MAAQRRILECRTDGVSREREMVYNDVIERLRLRGEADG